MIVIIIPNNNNKNRNNIIKPRLSETHILQRAPTGRADSALITGGQTREKLQRLYEDQMRITFEKARFKIYLAIR